MKFLRRIRLSFWRFFKQPLNYHFFNEGDAVDGIAVGLELKATHLTLHDMMPHACRWRLTAEQIMLGIDVNAIKILGFERIDAHIGITTFQPYKMRAI